MAAGSHRRRFLCFTVDPGAVSDGYPPAETSDPDLRRIRRKLLPRFLRSISSPSGKMRDKARRKESNLEMSPLRSATNDIVTPSSSSISSQSSSESSNSFPATARRNPAAMKVAPSRRSGLLLLLVSLSVTVFCGLMCAILWMSTWLGLFPRFRDYFARPDAAAVSPEMRMKLCDECEERRVVLEGSIEKNQSV